MSRRCLALSIQHGYSSLFSFFSQNYHAMSCGKNVQDLNGTLSGSFEVIEYLSFSGKKLA